MLQENHNNEKEGVIDTLFEKTRDYVETRADLFRLKAIKKTAEVGSSLISNTIIVIVFSSFFIFLNIGLGLWLGSILGASYLGFFSLSALYLIVGIIVFANRKTNAAKGSSFIQAHCS